MTIETRALTLNIDANSPEDMIALFKQALYELQKSMGNLNGEAKTNSNIASAYSTISGKRQVDGKMSGSLGSYSFNFLFCSREFLALEKSLLDQGYVFQRDSQNIFASDHYSHPSLGPKAIKTAPLAIVDYKG